MSDERFTHPEAGAGIDLDCILAERLFAYRRITGPTHDYEGPCEYGDVLIPPTLSDDEAFRMFPPREKINLCYFVGSRRWSTSLAGGWEVVAHMRRRGYALQPHETHPGGGTWVAAFGDVSAIYIYGNGRSPEEAICRAALSVVNQIAAEIPVKERN